MAYEIDFRKENGGIIKRLAWSTDLHLDAAGRSQSDVYLDLLIAHEPDIVLIGGDVSNGITTFAHLGNMAKRFEKDIFFVLGNHDFYNGSIPVIRNDAKNIGAIASNLHYLTDGAVIELSEQTALIGHDGWSDAYAGDFIKSDVMLNDYFLIDELKRLTHEERFLKLHELGEEAAVSVNKLLLTALEKYDRVILLIHVPPFVEACLYEGHPADDNWIPHFVNIATGKVLEAIMKTKPEKELLVLCGHTHWGQDIQILPNLRVVTGHSELGIPNVQGIIYIN
ncbi:MAG TPA: metallophosphoesterase [Parachlamydiaceae bacterium]|nr:metallophosphoesterase [Parachlamydiaceae bacterium]